MANWHDEQGFRSLYDRHHRAILQYFYRRLDPDEAFDAAGDVFLVAWRRLEDVPDGDDALAWLYGVAHRVLSNHDRTRRRSSRLIARLAHTPLDPPRGPELEVIRRREDQAVLDALSTLRPQDQELLLFAPRIRSYFGSPTGTSFPTLRSESSSAALDEPPTFAFTGPSHVYGKHSRLPDIEGPKGEQL